MSRNNGEREQLGTLQSEYRRAWKALILEAEGLQRAARADAGSADLSAARVRAEVAATNYRAARNRLAQALLTCAPAEAQAELKEHVESEREPVLVAACCAAN